jgi:hypothetical protein
MNIVMRRRPFCSLAEAPQPTATLPILRAYTMVTLSGHLESPKRLRKVHIRTRCICTGAMLAEQGEGWTFLGQLAPLVISAFLFPVPIYRLPDIALFKMLEIAVQGLLAYKVAPIQLK